MTAKYPQAGFQKGNKLAKGIGRPGYELEQEQLEIMRRIVSKDLKVVEKFYNGKAKAGDFKMLAALQVRVGKYLDKLHASKQELKGDPNRPILIKYIQKDGE